MTLLTIELNDCELRAANGTEIILRSPGYAVIQNEKIELGDAALKTARLHPRLTFNRYWNNLNQDSLQHPAKQVRHHADIAFAHLLAIHEQTGKPEEVLFAVPGYYSNEQLSLLLGLVEASPFKALGLVDSAVVATASLLDKGDYIHAEIHLHHTLLTFLHVSDEVSRTSVQVIDGVGLATIHDACAQLIADMFIKQSRFDPQHHAETEQALYNQIPECLVSLQTHSEVSLEIQYQNNLYQAKLSREALLDSLQPCYKKILDNIPSPGVCLTGDRLSMLPEFVARIKPAKVMKASNVFQGCQEYLTNICSTGSGINFVTQLPATTTPVITSTVQNKTTNGTANKNHNLCTHVLHGYHASPLLNGKLHLSATGTTNKEKQADSHCSITVNDKQLILKTESDLTVFINGIQLHDPVPVQAGDIISFAGSKTEYAFISVST